MAARFSSSAILRSALATHVSLSASSLLCSFVGPSQIPMTTDSEHQSLTSHCHHQDMANICASLPWLDQLHNLIAGMYVGGAMTNCCSDGCLQRNAMVQIGKDVSVENPIVSYAGMGEVERAVRGRRMLRPQNDVKTVLECMNVEASEDSISGGVAMDSTSTPSPTSLIGIPSPNNAPISPPKVEVTYRLSQQYGSFFSVQSLLVVTVQVRRGSSLEKVRHITPRKVAVPLATSGFTPRAACTVAAAAHSGPATLALAKAASKIVSAATRGQHTDIGCTPQSTAPLVAEVVRIEEKWNGVQLIHFTPFHWSRRLNGLVAGSIVFLLFH